MGLKSPSKRRTIMEQLVYSGDVNTVEFDCLSEALDIYPHRDRRDYVCDDDHIKVVNWAGKLNGEDFTHGIDVILRFNKIQYKEGQEFCYEHGERFMVDLAMGIQKDGTVVVTCPYCNRGSWAIIS
jgi:hypothetical protein